TPVAAGTPVGEAEEFAPLAGVVFQPLAFGSVEVLPLGPAGIGIGRLTLEPGAAIPPHPHLGPEFGVIEAGTASITVSEGELQVARGRQASLPAGVATPFVAPIVETFGAGDEVTLNPGDAVFYEPGTVADLRNAGDQPLVFLGGGIEPIGGAPATPEAATPIA
ncbi:MAG TPA: cupin domain-containing protein, partial [Thermomicrobiales bacterium]|nr:cupin domain-containing protein [Thermomicrobiales bacterium]